MIRFRCAHCGKAQMLSECKAGVMVICPRCGESSLPPDDEPEPDAELKTQENTSALVPWQGDEGPSLFEGMSPGLRWALALVAGAGLLCLFVPALSLVTGLEGVAGFLTYVAVLVVPASAVTLLAILYGHGSACPSCGAWWVRRKIGSEFVGRGVFDKGGVPHARSTYRTGFQCDSCQHRWSVTDSEEYREVVRRDRTRPRLG